MSAIKPIQIKPRRLTEERIGNIEFFQRSIEHLEVLRHT